MPHYVCLNMAKLEVNRSFVYFTANATLVVLLCVLQVQDSSCSLNLFLDKNESHRILGIPSEIYYIQAGKVRKNALSHTLKIAENYHTTHYIWERIPHYVVVRYMINFEILDKKLLRSVRLNVSNQGIVPSTRETVMIQFACSGLQSGRVIVNFHLKFTVDNSSIIEITFKREKYCVKEAHKISFDVDQQPLMENSDSSQLKIFYIVLCFGCSLFTLLILCFLAYVVSNKKDSRRNSLHAEQQIRLKPTETENVPYILNASAINSGTSTSSNISHSSMKKRKNYTQLDNRSLDLQDRISEITVQRKRIRLQKIELEGTFGRVFIGTYSKEDGSEEEVVVKTVMDFASSNQISLLLREGLTMYGLKHRNIMSVLGVSIEDHVEPFVVYLREGFTNLKKYLHKCKICQEGITRVLTTQEVVEIALQIIAGVQYMHKKKLLHKDLATRNCLMCIRPLFRGHLSSYATPFFLEYRRKNGARAKYDELVRERLRQIANRSVEEHLQRDVGPSVDNSDMNKSARMSVADFTAPAIRAYNTNDEQSVKKKDASSTSTTFSDVRLTNVEVIHDLLANASNAKRATSAVKPKVKRVPSGAKSAVKTPRTALPSVRAVVKNDRNVPTGDTRNLAPNAPTKGPFSKADNVAPTNVRGAKPTDDNFKKPISRSPSSSSGAKFDVSKTSEPEGSIAPDDRRGNNMTGASDGAGETIRSTPVARVDKDAPQSMNLASNERTPKSACLTPFFTAKIKRTSTPSSSKPVKEPFSNPITFPPTTLPSSLSQNEQVELMRRERRLERAWRELERRISKSVPFPLKAPAYLKEPPELSFEQTRTCELRRDLNHKRVYEIETKKKFVRGQTPLKYIEPKPNLTQKLRYKQLKRKPIFSEFFERYYSKYRKPPFQSIDGSLNVKVADNALSRDLFPNDYHCLGDNENRPVQWLAVESLVHRTFSTASDVWSFGVTLWELTTLGQQPYVEVDPFEIEHYLKDGYRLSQPVNCPDELFAVMAYCWAMSADERPTFSQLLTCLQDFRNQLNKYV